MKRKNDGLQMVTTEEEQEEKEKEEKEKKEGRLMEDMSRSIPCQVQF